MPVMVPVVFVWTEVALQDGELREVMVPAPRYAKVAHRQFEPDHEYPLVVLETRSRASHNQYFAALSDGFDNLPEDLEDAAERLGLKSIPKDGFQDADHLRKWALCETGWCDIGEFLFETQEEAERLCKYFRRNDSYAIITLGFRGNHVLVTIKTAKSQSAPNMAKQAFEDSKRDVLTLVEAMTNLKKGALMKNAGRSA